MKYQNIGVDLGNRIVKISILEQIDEINEDYQITDAQKYFVPDGVDLGEYFKFVEDSIKTFLKMNGLKHIRINLTVPCDDENMIANCFKIPKVDDSVLEDSILFEVESYVTIEKRNYKHQYEILKEFEDTGEILVLSVLAKRDFIEQVLELRRFRWKIDQLEPQFYIGNQVLQDDSVLVDFGFYNTRIYLYEDGTITDIDIISIGTIDFINKISDMYDTNLEQSEEILKNSQIENSFIGEENQQLKFNMDEDLEILIQQLTEITSEITEELKRNIRVMELNKNLMIESMYYSGELSNLEYFIAFISNDLEIKMKPFNFLTITGFDFYDYFENLQSPEDNDENLEANRIDVENSTDKKDDDILKIGDLEEFEEIKKIKDEFEKVEPFIYSSLANIKNDSKFNFLKDIKFYIDRTSLLVGLLCATLFTQVGIWAINKNYDRKIGLGSSYLTEIENKNSELEYEIMDLNDNMDRNKTIINRVENLKDKKKWLSDILYVLPGGTPTNTGITDVSIEAGHAILKGYSEDYSSVGYLAMALEEYGEVTITEVGEKTNPTDHRVEGNVKMYKEFIMDITYDHRLISDDEPVTEGETLKGHDKSNEKVEDDDIKDDMEDDKKQIES